VRARGGSVEFELRREVWGSEQPRGGGESGGGETGGGVPRGVPAVVLLEHPHCGVVQAKEWGGRHINNVTTLLAPT